jgi:hypothetical protein
MLDADYANLCFIKAHLYLNIIPATLILHTPKDARLAHSLPKHTHPSFSATGSICSTLSQQKKSGWHKMPA